jgi:hypothetical protein
MDKAKQSQELESIHQEYIDDIREFWDFALWSAKAVSEARKLDAELEQLLPAALGSLKYNPQQVNRFPRSNRILIKILLVYEIILLDEMINRYKRLGKEMNFKIDKEFWKAEKLFAKLGEKSKNLQCGRIIRDLLVHNKGVMNKRTYKRFPICQSICQVGQEVPLQFDLIYSVADGLAELNEHLLRLFERKLTKSPARVGQEPCAPDDIQEEKRMSRPQGS